jgi:hypothetical protein
MATYQFNFYTTPTSFVEIITDGVSKSTFGGGEISSSFAGDGVMLSDNRGSTRAAFGRSIRDVGDITAIEIDGVAQALPASLDVFYETYKGYFFKASASGGAGGSVIDVVYNSTTGDLTLTQTSGTSPIVAFIPPQTVANLADTAFINTVFGNDGTGVIGDLSKPYLTFSGALASGALFVESVTNVANFAGPVLVDRSVTIVTNSFNWTSAAFPLFNFQSTGSDINVAFVSGLANCDTGSGTPNYFVSSVDASKPNINCIGKFFNNHNGGSIATLTASGGDANTNNFPFITGDFVDVELTNCNANCTGDVPVIAGAANIDWKGGDVFEEAITFPAFVGMIGARLEIKHRTKSGGAGKLVPVISYDTLPTVVNTAVVLKGTSINMSVVTGDIACIDTTLSTISIDATTSLTAGGAATNTVIGNGTLSLLTSRGNESIASTVNVSGSGFFTDTAADIQTWAGRDVHSVADKSFWKPYNAGTFWDFNFPADAGATIGQFVKWQEGSSEQDIFSANGESHIFQNDLKWQATALDYTGGVGSKLVVDPTAAGLDATFEGDRGLGMGYGGVLPTYAGLDDNAFITKAMQSAILNYDASSGLFTDGEGILTVGTGGAGVATTFSISDGTGQTEMNGVVTPVTWSGLTDIAVTNIATQNITFVAINSVGAVVQQSSRWTDEFARDNIILGVVVHVNRVNVDTVNNEQEVINNASAQVGDVLEALGFFNVSGNVFSAFSTNLQIEKSVGVMAGRGIGFDTNGHKNPHTKTLSILNPITALQYRMQDGSSGSIAATVVDPTIWDDGSPFGSAPTVPTNRFTIQRIYSFTSNNVKIQPGQTIYNSLAAAKGAIQTEVFVTEPSVAANGMLRAFLIVKGDTTDLSDASKVLFLDAGKFGSSTGAGGASSGASVIEGESAAINGGLDLTSNTLYNTTITVTGAVVGDKVDCGVSDALASFISTGAPSGARLESIIAHVSSADTVTVSISVSAFVTGSANYKTWARIVK